MYNYQPLYSNGEIANKYERECADRYAFFKTIFDKFKRPFSVLDIGANLSYFGRRIVEDYPLATVISVEKEEIFLNRGLKGQPLIGLNARVDAVNTKKWTSTEMFDVVLCLSVLHHFKKDDAIKSLISIMSLGFEVLVENPGKDDINAGIRETNLALHDYLESFIAPKVYFPSHTTKNVMRPTYLFTNFGKHIFTNWAVDYGENPFIHGVTNKVIWKGYKDFPLFCHFLGYERDWIPGINLNTLAEYKGCFGHTKLEDLIAQIKIARPHNDILPRNVIVSRDAMELIDYDHFETLSDEEGINKLYELKTKIKTL